jgi:hypothetical protein
MTIPSKTEKMTRPRVRVVKASKDMKKKKVVSDHDNSGYSKTLSISSDPQVVAPGLVAGARQRHNRGSDEWGPNTPAQNSS